MHKPDFLPHEQMDLNTITEIRRPANADAATVGRNICMSLPAGPMT